MEIEIAREIEIDIDSDIVRFVDTDTDIDADRYGPSRRTPGSGTPVSEIFIIEDEPALLPLFSEHAF
jgi:hypothetical protein